MKEREVWVSRPGRGTGWGRGGWRNPETRAEVRVSERVSPRIEVMQGRDLFECGSKKVCTEIPRIDRWGTSLEGLGGA